MGQILILCLIGISLILGFVGVSRQKRMDWRFAPADRPDPAQPSCFDEVFRYDIAVGQAHAPALVVSSGGMEVLWFEGSAEAQADVDIKSAILTRTGAGWHADPCGAHITRGGLAKVMSPRQLVVTLGNMVDAGRTGQIFLTLVSVGGWAMASVAQVMRDATGPVQARKLALSPVLNRSFLVKSPLVRFADGDHGLPAYFEMGATYGALVRVGATGRVRDTSRIAGPGKPIQPMIVPFDARNAVAFLRDFHSSGRLWFSETTDGGRHWSHAADAGLPNPSAPVAAVPLGEDAALVAVNDDPSGGDRLSLLRWCRATGVWQHLRSLESNGAGARYPMMQVLPDGQIALTYSVANKRGIRVQVFSLAWAEAGAIGRRQVE